MKTRFNTYDIICSITELQRLVGLRVNQVYDIDNRSYLIRLQEKDVKLVLLLESGNRFHTTAFEWPKNMAPSGFTMKLRKHLKNKRLEKLEQLGIDRIIDLQFGMGEAAYHVILELYDRGNIILTDYEMTILNILRPHVEGEVVRFAVREKYPECRAKEHSGRISTTDLQKILEASPGDNLKKILNPILPFGPALIDHIITIHNMVGVKIGEIAGEQKSNYTTTDWQKGKKNAKNKKDDGPKRIFNMQTDLPILMKAIHEAYVIMEEARGMKSKGYIIQKRELKPTQNGEDDYFSHNVEYHPYLFAQLKDQPHKEFDSFDAAVDEFYSTLEGQKIDIKALQQEREALKKLSNVKKDHEKRIEDLSKTQVFDKQRAELITRNQVLVDNAILAIRSAIANQMSWPDIHELVKVAQGNGDSVASCIKQLKLDTNHISLYLTDPYIDSDADNDGAEKLENQETLKPMTIDIDLGLSAFSNASRYYDQKRSAAKKEHRTIESSTKALKSAERKTQQTLKEVRTISTITKARKVYWFEKFYWFISTENYLVIGGRDQQQNELIVKRYMRPTDVYVHAEIQGASSVVIRNPSGTDIPPKTLLEAGAMAISYSVAWEAKVVTNAYWVKSDQVSKTAPTGEYLGTGSFMIRGKKNFLPQCHLVLGLSFLFKLEESSVARHAGERRVRHFDDDDINTKDISEIIIENEKLEDVIEEAEQEIDLSESDNEESVSNKDHVNNDIVDSAIIDTNLDEAYSDDDAEDGIVFPDTHITIEHNTGKVILQSDPKLERTKSECEAQENVISLGDEQSYIIHAAAQRVKIKQNKQKKNDRATRKGKKPQNIEEKEEEENENKEEIKPSQPKRRQKAKLKKIKEKYKDQDEEEKRIRMEILKSAGTGKSSKKPTKQNEHELIKEASKKSDPKPQQPIDCDDIDDTPAGADVDMLDTLTGCPLEEDEILFAVPVIAPYQAMQNYKYKVKLTPGTGRRGKAAKTALLIFMKDKSCSSREKDLLKGVKDEMIARNMPGKVKLSAPQLQKFKK